MGYYATGSGSVTLKTWPPDEVMERCNALFPSCDFDDKRKVLYVEAYEKYHEEDPQELLEILAPYAEDGMIEYFGDDGFHWRFVLQNGEVTEDNGRIVYDSDPAVDLPRNELKRMLSDIFNTVIDVCGIDSYTIEQYNDACDKITGILESKQIL